MKDKVSIVLPTYNGSKFIKESIDSCLKQSFKDIEVIVVDDCSTDNTPEVVKSYTDERLKYILHQKNCKLPAALNTGFNAAQGNYLTWTSDDNYYSPKAIEKMVSFLKKRNGDFVYADYFRFAEEDPANSFLVSLPDQPKLKESNTIGACFMYTRQVQDKVGLYDEETFTAEDYEYWIRVSKKFKMLHLPESLYYYREHSSSLSATKALEVQSSRLLVLLKTELLKSPLEATEYFIDSLASQGLPTKIYRINQSLLKFSLEKDLTVILQDYQGRKIDFHIARRQIKGLLARSALKEIIKGFFCLKIKV